MDAQYLPKLKLLGQEHLVAFWDALDGGDAKSLAAQIKVSTLT